jgi:hypothetical protein
MRPRNTKIIDRPRPKTVEGSCAVDDSQKVQVEILDALHLVTAGLSEKISFRRQRKRVLAKMEAALGLNDLPADVLILVLRSVVERPRKLISPFRVLQRL